LATKEGQAPPEPLTVLSQPGAMRLGGVIIVLWRAGLRPPLLSRRDLEATGRNRRWLRRVRLMRRRCRDASPRSARARRTGDAPLAGPVIRFVSPRRS